MRSTLENKTGRRALVGASVALAVLLPTASAATIGINFQDDWSTGGGAEVTQDAFGVESARWFNMPRVFNSIAGPSVSSNAVVMLPEGGALQVEWSCVNTYSLAADIPTGPGESEVIYGYLDDTGVGYRVRVSGFRDAVANYTLTLIASTDSGEGFTDATVAFGTDTNTVQYTEIQFPDFASGAYSVSSATGEIVTLEDNNSVVITGTPRSGALRSTLAGLLVSYTPGGSNPPRIEQQPVGPTGTTFAGSPFTLQAAVSGSPALAYQWRLDGEPVDLATNAVYSKAVSSVADSGAYDLVVTNPFGSVTSSIVNVEISAVVAPQIVSGPVSQSLYPGYPATFTVTATGGQLAYQWRKGSQVIEGATGPTYTIPSVGPADPGTYTVTVTNSQGTQEASATLAVVDPGSPYPTAVAASKPIVYFRMSETGAVQQVTATNRGSLATAGTGLYVGSYSVPVPGALVGSSDTAVRLSGGRVSVGYQAAVNPTGSFTVECWANPNDVGSGNRVLVQSMINGQFVENANDRSGWVLRQAGANLEFLIGGDIGAPFYTTIVTAQSAVTAGTWSHYAATYNAETFAVGLYVNGVEVTNVVAAAPLLPNTAAPLLLGDRGYGGWTFQGSLDEVAVYASLLTPAKILSHYETGSSAATSAGYPDLVVADGAVEYLRLDDAPLPAGANASANRGTWGGAWNGQYIGAGTVLGDPLVATGTVGPRPEPFVGLEPGNTAVGMTNGWVTSPQLVLGNEVTAVVWINRQEISTTGDLSWPAWLGGGGMHLNNGTASNPDAELRYHWNGGEWGWSSGLFVPANVWTFAALVVSPTNAVMYMSEGTTLLTSTNEVSHAPDRKSVV